MNSPTESLDWSCLMKKVRLDVILIVANMCVFFCTHFYVCLSKLEHWYKSIVTFIV